MYTPALNMNNPIFSGWEAFYNSPALTLSRQRKSIYLHFRTATIFPPSTLKCTPLSAALRSSSVSFFWRELELVHSGSMTGSAYRGPNICGHKVRCFLDLVATKPVSGGLRTTKAQTSLRIRTDWSAPLLFSYWKISYLNLLQVKF